MNLKVRFFYRVFALSIDIKGKSALRGGREHIISRTEEDIVDVKHATGHFIARVEVYEKII